MYICSRLFDTATFFSHAVNNKTNMQTKYTQAYSDKDIVFQQSMYSLLYIFMKILNDCKLKSKRENSKILNCICKIALKRQYQKHFFVISKQTILITSKWGYQKEIACNEILWSTTHVHMRLYWRKKNEQTFLLHVLSCYDKPLLVNDKKAFDLQSTNTIQIKIKNSVFISAFKLTIISCM